jgi:hypothetical protein
MQSCVVVKEYDKLYINDPDMKLAAASKAMKLHFQVYRESRSRGKWRKNRWWMWL